MRRGGKSSPLRVLEGAGPCHPLDCRLLASCIVSQYIPIVFSPPVCGNFLQQPWERNTPHLSAHLSPACILPDS